MSTPLTTLGARESSLLLSSTEPAAIGERAPASTRRDSLTSLAPTTTPSSGHRRCIERVTAFVVEYVMEKYHYIKNWLQCGCCLVRERCFSTEGVDGNTDGIREGLWWVKVASFFTGAIPNWETSALLNALNEEERGTLGIFLRRLDQMADTSTSPGMIMSQASAFCGAMIESDVFRQKALQEMREVATNCGDRVRIYFQRIELAYQIYCDPRMEDPAYFAQTAYSKARIHLLEEISSFGIAGRNGHIWAPSMGGERPIGENIGAWDQIETFFYLLIQLKEQLQLQVSARRMLYRAHVTDELLHAIGDSVLARTSTLVDKVKILCHGQRYAGEWSEKWEELVMRQAALQPQFAALIELLGDFAETAVDGEGFPFHSLLVRLNEVLLTDAQLTSLAEVACREAEARPMVIENRNELIAAQIPETAPDRQRLLLIAKSILAASPQFCAEHEMSSGTQLAVTAFLTKVKQQYIEEATRGFVETGHFSSLSATTSVT